MRAKLFPGIVSLCLLSLTSCAQDGSDTSYVRPNDTMEFVVSWKRIGDGVDFCETDAPLKSIIGDSKLTMLRIDANKVDFELFTATNRDKKPHPVNEWADSLRLNIVFNAGMYDLSKPLVSRGLLKNGKHFNQAALHPTFNTMLALNPVDTAKADCALFDLELQPYASFKDKYHCLAQGLRMLDGNGNPMNWKKRVQSCSMLLMAEDKDHNLYLIFTRSPYVHNQMIAFLKQFPVPLKNAIYLEGGPETSLYVSIGDFKLAKVGSYVSQTYEKDTNKHFWPLPNVIGVKVRD